jgi:glycosyltransferase involved in cell wall biosynthesis
MPRTTAPLRVCLLTGSFFPIVGGGETHARLLCRELIRTGTPVLIVTQRRQRHLAPFESVDGIPVYRVAPAGFPRWGKYLMLPNAFLRLVRMRREYDVIYVAGLRVLGVIGVLAARWLHKKCVLRSASCGELSGEFIWQAPQGGNRRRLRRLFGSAVRLRNAVLKKADSFLGISDAIRQEYLACGVPADKIAVIRNGTDTELYAPADAPARAALRRQLGLPFQALIGAYSGKLDKGKGLEFLLRVWRRFVAERPRAHLLLIGSGGMQYISCEQALRDFVAAHNLAGSVTFTGYVRNVHEFLKASDFFVFPSESEALGNALLEALACGLPAVGSRTGGIVDIIHDGDNGRLAGVGDEAEWLHILLELADRPEKALALGRRGREAILERFSIQRAAADHRRLFERLTAAGGGA